MTYQDCVKLASDNPVGYLATLDGDQPRVRAFLLWFADEKGFCFGGLSSKAVYSQMKKHPKVEVCFYNNPKDFADSRMLRVCGEVEFLEDTETKQKLLEARPFYKSFGTGKPEDKIYFAFRIRKGEAYVWTPADIMKERAISHIRF